MIEKTILVIDDSATIRRLCDSELSNAGYRVILAPTAEEGISMAAEQTPDLIILDHQLPGTTGYEVCCQLLEQTDTAKIPVVASSTLRKKAYAQYVDCDNVVDMLPKPYTPEALVATIASALNTAAMVVQSQNEGSSVPEVINELGEPELSGTFDCFGLREVLDMLNNGSKMGVLEVETIRCRVFVHVGRGRIQAVTASGVDPEIVARHMPESLQELSPVIRLTVPGRRGSEVDGLVELLNNKVLDPRLLKKLLRLQAAVLLRHCFTGELKSFRFTNNQDVPPLFKKLPINESLLSLLVEGALLCHEDELPNYKALGFVRKSIRGQNLDRAGLSSRHMKLVNLVAEPKTLEQISEQSGWPRIEVQRVLHGFVLAQLIENCEVMSKQTVQGVTENPAVGRNLASFIHANQNEITGKIFRDWSTLRSAFSQQQPDVLIVDLNCESAMHELAESRLAFADVFRSVKIIGISKDGAADPDLGLDILLGNDFTPEELAQAIGKTTSRQSSSEEPSSAQSSREESSDAPSKQLSVLPIVIPTVHPGADLSNAVSLESSLDIAPIVSITCEG